MTYDEFKTAIVEYCELFYNKGLKKQANKKLFEFADNFKKDVPQTEKDDILFRFCRELLEEEKFPEFRSFHFSLPFQISGLVFDYLIGECEKNKMPQMRWEYQLFGKYYNPHDRECEHDPYEILKRAYDHPECDQQTVDLYFNAQLNELGFGAHHFPEGCCIAREYYRECVEICEKILSEKTVSEEMRQEFFEYKTLYEIYYKWNDNGRVGRFDEICRKAGLDFAPVPAYYYTK